MRTIFNEGRVVGLSAYEIYLRNVLAMDPNADVLSESNWISSSVSNGNSMILHIASGTSKGVHDYVLPQGSTLVGCNTVYGNLFEGEVLLDDSGTWATTVISYGRLISNTSDLHPVAPGEPDNVPYVSNAEVLPDSYLNECQQYLKVNSALVIQPGEWNEIVSRYDLTPDMSKRGFVRIALSEETTSDINILFTGFKLKSGIQGTIADTGSAHSENPSDGDFLGPAVFPWAVKAILNMTTDIYSVFKSSENSVKEEVTNVKEEVTNVKEAFIFDPSTGKLTINLDKLS